VDDPSSARQGAGESPRSRARTATAAVRRRFEGSPAQTFTRHLAALDFTNTIVLFGAALLISVLPFRLYETIGVVFSLMIWFMAIGAVIVLGAVAGATWNSGKAVPGASEPK
jgi:hypothetical protein